MDGRPEIVIIEAEAQDAELIGRVLEQSVPAAPFAVLRDGIEAMNFFFAPGGLARDRLLAPRVILLDLKLPNVNGIEILRRLKSNERTRGIPVVVLTNSPEGPDLQEAYDFGANSCVPKPPGCDDFSRVVAEVAAYWLVLNRLPC